MVTHAQSNDLHSPAAALQWNLELLWRMDWKRFQELISHILACGGFDSEIAWIRPDGTTGLSVVSVRNPDNSEALLQCAGWNALHVGGTSLLDFYRSALNQGVHRGIYVTPGTFDQNARIFAKSKNIELIDGEEFIRTIGRMTESEQETILRMALTGAWNVPTCPSCVRKLSLQDIGVPTGQNQQDLRDVVFHESQHVSNQLFCRHLVVKPGAEVLFLKGLEVESMSVHGRAMGNIVCRGQLSVTSGGCIGGLVAARTIQLETGGLLEAEARILNEEELNPVQSQPKRWSWNCTTSRCKGSLPLRN